MRLIELLRRHTIGQWTYVFDFWIHETGTAVKQTTISGQRSYVIAETGVRIAWIASDGELVFNVGGRDDLCRLINARQQIK